MVSRKESVRGGATGPSASMQWENAAAGAAAGFATVAALHPLDVVRTRFQVNDGKASNLPRYRNTCHAVYLIGRSEMIVALEGSCTKPLVAIVRNKIMLLKGLRGLYAGFSPAVLGSTAAWGLYFLFYNRAKQRYLRGSREPLNPGYHLISATEAGSLVCLCTNPIWLVKTRLQLQTPLQHGRPYSGFSDAFRTILREEGLRALYRGIVPGLFLVSHGAIQFTVYEELRKVAVQLRGESGSNENVQKLLNSFDYAILGASSKFAAMLLTYPYQVIRARLQQRPRSDGLPKYTNSWHVVRETLRFEGFRGFYKGITPNLLKNMPAASITFIVYENVLSFLNSRR